MLRSLLTNPDRLTFAQAIQLGKLKVVQGYHQSDPSLITQQLPTGRTPIIEATAAGQLEIVKWLVSKGASLTDKDDKGNTPFLTAIWSLKKKVAIFFLEHDSSVAADHGEYDKTALEVIESSWVFQKEFDDGFIQLFQKQLSKHQQKLSEMKALPTKEREPPSQSVVAIVASSPQTPTTDAKEKSTLSLELFEAAARGDLTTVQRLWRPDFSKEEEAKFDKTVIQTAFENFQIGIVMWLLENGYKLTEKTKDDDRTLLMLAAQYGSLKAVQLLLQKGATVTDRNKLGRTAILLATKSGNLEIIVCLKKHGASLTDQDNNGDTISSLAAWYKFESIKNWLESGAPDEMPAREQKATSPTPSSIPSEQPTISEPPPSPSKPLSLLDAAATGQLEAIQQQWKPGSNNEKDLLGYTPLLLAAKNGHEGAALWLLDNGSSCQQEKTQVGNTAFLLAVMNGHFSLAEKFLERGATIDERDNYNNTALILAAGAGKLEAVQWLLSKGATLNATNKLGNTPLLQAAERDQPHVVEWMLSNGADRTQRRRDGKGLLDLAGKKVKDFLLPPSAPPADYSSSLSASSASATSREEEKKKPAPSRLTLLEAVINGDLAALKELARENKGALLTEKDKFGRSSLLLAAQHGHTPIIKWLVEEQGVPLTGRDTNDSSALLLAVENEHLDTADYLLQQGASLAATTRVGQSAFDLAKTEEMRALLRKYKADEAPASPSLEAKRATAAKPDARPSSAPKAPTAVPATISSALPRKQTLWARLRANKSNPDNLTFLEAVEQNRVITVKWFLKGYHDISDKQNKNDGKIKEKAILLACANGHLEMLKLLMKLTFIFYKTKDSDGNTPFMLAAKNDQLEVVKYLLYYHKACLADKNNHGQTAIDLAAGETRKFLEAHTSELRKLTQSKGVKGSWSKIKEMTGIDLTLPSSPSPLAIAPGKRLHLLYPLSQSKAASSHYQQPTEEQPVYGYREEDMPTSQRAAVTDGSTSVSPSSSIHDEKKSTKAITTREEFVAAFATAVKAEELPAEPDEPGQEEYYRAQDYFRGRGVDKDLITGVRWLKKAAAKGNASACFDLAVCYDKATGVDRDETQAVYWYQKGASLNPEFAQAVGEVVKLAEEARNLEAQKSQPFSRPAF